MVRKVSLTANENLCAAYAHFVLGVDQHVLAPIMGGVNPGRVNEAVKAIEYAMNNVAEVNNLAKAAKGVAA